MKEFAMKITGITVNQIINVEEDLILVDQINVAMILTTTTQNLYQFHSHNLPDHATNTQIVE